MTVRIAVAGLLGMMIGLVALQAQAAGMTEDKGHVYNWNKFADDLYVLHERQLEGRQVRWETSVGGYPGNRNYYEETRYFDADSGRLLSIVQREMANRRNVHSISVNVYDEQGRLLRDYSASYLPDARNAPTQTLIFLHRYNDGVHAFRSFDASDDMLYQRCEGSYQGKPVFISMDIEEIDDAAGELYQHQRGIMATPVYKHCFGSMPETAAAVIPPR